jgi:penicillin-binding protein 1C
VPPLTTDVQIVQATPRRRAGRVALGILLLLLLILVFAGFALFETIRDIERRYPAPKDTQVLPTSRVVVDRSDRLLRPFTIANGRWRLPVTKADVDPHFLDMLLAYEDKRFYAHDGVDYRAFARAAVQFVAAGGIVSGASTLTMQVARLATEGETRSPMGKLRQIAMARALEKRFSKDEILTLYLTLAPYGGNLEGIRAASLAYFGKEPKRLTPAEAALLVALPQSPEARRPDRDANAARAARDRVLDRMERAGVIDDDTAEAAKHERVPDGRKAFPMLAAHLGQEALRAQPDRKIVKLTIDRELQAALERLARDRIAPLGPKLSAAIVVADHRTGDILASVGSAGLFEEQRDGYVDMTRALRSPGSTLKPLIYGLAFEQGLAHPESLIEDRPTAFSGYAPTNFDGEYRGTVTIREALTQSLNVPAVIVLDAVGPARLFARLKRAAAHPLLPDLSAPGLAIGLGGVGLSLRDLVAVYGAIARGGAPLALHDGVDGSAAPVQPDDASPVLDRSAAWYVSDILADVPPPVNGSKGRLAYKTGTSYGYRDAWAIGFDGRYVVGVWIGRPDGTPVSGLSGITAAAPVLFEAFDRIAPTRVPLKAPPPGTIEATTAELPPPLRRFRHPDAQVVARDSDPEIAFPLDGAAVDLGIAAGDPGPLTIKIRNGEPPFTFFANGVPIGRPPFARSETWKPDGAGFVTLSVVDATGRSDRVTVFVE